MQETWKIVFLFVEKDTASAEPVLHENVTEHESMQLIQDATHIFHDTEF
jgi:hypothetical protein